MSTIRKNISEERSGPAVAQTVRIAEIYQSIQGEGLLTGTRAVFVRTSGCNLRCWFCDTPHTSWEPEGERLLVAEILRQVDRFDTPYVVVTGGEPMLEKQIVPLTDSLRRCGRHITIETAGTIYLPVACDLMSISPKLSNSTPSPARDAAWSQRHEQRRHVPEVVRRLAAEYPYQVKFVVDGPGDLQEVEAYLNEMPQIDRRRAMLMPQGTTGDELHHKSVWLEAYCREKGLLFCPRRQIEWFGLVRGT